MHPLFMMAQGLAKIVLRSIPNTFIKVGVFFVVSLAQLGCSSASLNLFFTAKDPSVDSNTVKDRTFQAADFRDQCQREDNSRIKCKISIAGPYLCDDCYNDLIIDVPAFPKFNRVSDIWAPFVLALGNVINAYPFVLQMQTKNQEKDKACFERDHLPSKVLGPPYFEFASVCVQAYNTTEPVQGIAVKWIMNLSVTKNPHSPYREPEIGETSKYTEALKQAYRKAIDGACFGLQGRMLGVTCQR